ncbi:MAG: hypothetical protein K8T91_03635 [Planctomycetes bacterium]|nr:hypothetical protein [Planctomycetota bacterium]
MLYRPRHWQLNCCWLAICIAGCCCGCTFTSGSLKDRVVGHGGTVTDSDEGLLIDLAKSKFTDADLATLGDLGGVHAMVLRKTAVTNQGLVYLKSARRLATLDLSNTQITDAGLQSLTSLSQLHDLVLLGCEVSEDGVAKLKQAMPNVEIACDAPWTATAKGNP